MEDSVYFIHFATKPEKDDTNLYYQYLTVQKMPLRQAEHKISILKEIYYIFQRTNKSLPKAKKQPLETPESYESRKIQLEKERQLILNRNIKSVAIKYSQVLGVREVYQIKCDSLNQSEIYASGQLMLVLPNDARLVESNNELYGLEHAVRTV